MANVWVLALIAGPTLLASAGATYLWSGHDWRDESLDQPGARRLHTAATPRGGGIGIFLTSLLAMFALALTVPQETLYWLLSGLGLFICAGAGLLDDLHRLSNRGKFALQAVAAVLLAIASQSLAGGNGTLATGVAIVVFTLMLVNFVNFMDGSNGLVATQAVLLASALLAAGMLAPAPLLLAAVTLAATLGFLPFNFPRARVFLGDVGSHALGFCLAVLFSRSWAEGYLGFELSFVLLSALLMDAGLTLGLRAVTGRRFWQAHCDHLYQWALRVGASHSLVAFAYAAWTLAAIATAITLRDANVFVQDVAAGIAMFGSILIYAGFRWRWAGNIREQRLQ